MRESVAGILLSTALRESKTTIIEAPNAKKLMIARSRFL